MVSRVYSVAYSGIHVTEVEVQVQMTAGLPVFTIVGLPDKAVAESKERVRAAIQSLGLSLPTKRITVNLAPSDLAKEGSHFDLPIAIAILISMGAIPSDAIDDYYVMGELSLDGRILPVSGVLPAAIAANAKDYGIICPANNGSEACWAGENMTVLAAPSILALINHVKGYQQLSAPEIHVVDKNIPAVDMKDVKGQQTAKRALEIAAAGGHNLLMSGSPGTGKSMLASALAGILPPLTAEEMLESSMIKSISGGFAGGKMSSERPYRSPHHSASMAAMVGGGRKAMPGEVSLAHNGVLFLDELPEFSRSVLESLRQPLETGEVTVARANAHLTYPANFQFISAMNPCKCGYLGDADLACSKAPKCAGDYQAKISGPLLDRIDLYVEMPMIDTIEMIKKEDGEASAIVAKRVVKAREVQYDRLQNTHGAKNKINASISGDELERITKLDAKTMKLLEAAMVKFKLSMRAYTRIRRVARTIADLEQMESIQSHHVTEALSYRRVRYGW